LFDLSLQEWKDMVLNLGITNRTSVTTVM